MGKIDGLAQSRKMPFPVIPVPPQKRGKPRTEYSFINHFWTKAGDYDALKAGPG